MSLSLGDWYDWWRALNMAVCMACVIVLGRRFVKNHHDWNTKTRDLWFALVLWSVAGISLSLEAILQDLSFTPRVEFLFVASVVTLKGVARKDAWGGHDT